MSHSTPVSARNSDVISSCCPVQVKNTCGIWLDVNAKIEEDDNSLLFLFFICYSLCIGPHAAVCNHLRAVDGLLQLRLLSPNFCRVLTPCCCCASVQS